MAAKASGKVGMTLGTRIPHLMEQTRTTAAWPRLPQPVVGGQGDPLARARSARRRRK